MPRQGPSFGSLAFLTLVFALSAYFTYASIQGEHGLFRQVQIEAEAAALRQERDRLRREVAHMANKTRRLSDDYLDLDLLDEQVRATLGLVRADEIVIR